MSGWGNGEGVDPWGKAAADAAVDTTFDTGSMSAALPDGQTAAGEASGADTNGTHTNGVASDAKDLDPDAMKKMVKDHGWSEAVPYDYGRYTGPDVTGTATWEGSAAVYEWDGEEGDIGPVHDQLELALFGDPAKRESSGIDFSK